MGKRKSVFPKVLMDDQQGKAIKTLWLVAFICFIFMTMEFLGGIFSGSLSIMIDAAHLSSDLLGFLISIFAIKVG
jgi:zinc transporter 2